MSEIKHYTVREGYTFVKGATVIGKELYLGTNDSIENYKQVADTELEEEQQTEMKSEE